MSHVARFLDPALIERLSQLQLTARSVVEGTTAGLHRSPMKGASVEFRQHRIYTAGDYALVYFDDDSWVLAEQIGMTGLVWFRGQAEMSVAASRPTRMATPLDGLIEYCESTSPAISVRSLCPGTPAAHVRCESRNHQLILERR